MRISCNCLKYGVVLELPVVHIREQINETWSPMPVLLFVRYSTVVSSKYSSTNELIKIIAGNVVDQEEGDIVLALACRYRTKRNRVEQQIPEDPGYLSYCLTLHIPSYVELFGLANVTD